MCEINFIYCFKDVISLPNIPVAQHLLRLNFGLCYCFQNNGLLFHLHVDNMP